MTTLELLARFVERDKRAVESFREAFPYSAPLEARLAFSDERLMDATTLLCEVVRRLAAVEMGNAQRADGQPITNHGGES